MTNFSILWEPAAKLPALPDNTLDLLFPTPGPVQLPEGTLDLLFPVLA